MSSEDYPDAEWKHTMTGDAAEEVTIVAYAPDGHLLGAVTIDIDENPRRKANVLLASPAAREEFARAWMEACRRADGEAAVAGVSAPPVTPLDTALQHVREARQFLAERNRYRKALETIAILDDGGSWANHGGFIAREALEGEPPATPGQDGRRADGEAAVAAAPMLEAAGLCVQRAESAAGLNVYVCTERLGHDDDGWHYDPLASEWWRRTADGVEHVKDPRHRT